MISNLFLIWLFLFSCEFNFEVSLNSFEQLEVEILAEYPHDPRAFTQGLIWHAGELFESTGRYGSSSLRRVRLKDGKVLDKVSLQPTLFGEGLTRIEDRLIQLTWREQIALVYDHESLRETERIEYSGEGWGLTYDGSWLIMSDGTARLTFRDPRSFGVWRRLSVTLEGKPLELLNELEYAEGFIYANVWNSSRIVKIDPQSGNVKAVIDAASLPYKPSAYGEDVLNGIAYIPEKQTFLLTGKLWPVIYEVRFK